MWMLLAISLGLGGGEGLPDPLFEEVGARALPGVVTVCGGAEKDYILEVNGGGIVVEDFDGDGNLDLFVIDGSTLERVRAGEPGFAPRLFLGDGKLGFRPAGESWALAGGRWGMGGVAGDLDGDGWPDLVITEWGRDRVILNEGGQGFRELPFEQTGLVGARWGTSAVLADLDGDGVLDLVVVNYLAFDPDAVPRRGEGPKWKGHDVMYGPEGLVPVHDQLYLGNGDGSFREVSRARGFVPAEAGFGLGIVAFDYEGDGDVDLYVTNDSTPNHLWRNEGDGTFTEVGFRAGVSHDATGREQAGMGIAVGDFDGDGAPDLFVTNFSGESNALYRSGRAGSFRESSTRADLVRPSLLRLGWGTGFCDFDLDGRLDLFVLNGHVYPQADLAGTDTSYAQADQLFLNVGEGRFVERALSSAPPGVTRAGVAADLDRNGTLDLVALELGGPVRVLRNRLEPGPQRRWLTVRLRGRGPNTAGVGARLVAEWEGGRAVREVMTSAGYQAGCPAEVHFGLGAAQALERLVVRWPSGHEQILSDVALDRLLVIEEPEPAPDGAQDGER